MIIIYIFVNNKKEAINLKKNTEDSIEGFGERREWENDIVIL